MALSIFDNKVYKPEDNDLVVVLGETLDYWNQIKDFVLEKYPSAKQEWNFSGKSYGWGFRLSDKKRVIVYLTPQDAFFLFAIVLGEQATNKALESEISDFVKQEIRSANVFAEGRGIRFVVRDESIINDLKVLIEIKIGK